MTTDKEQDLLRSMLVMASAGLDAMVKYLITDTLPTLIGRDERARNSFEKFVGRELNRDTKLLASVLAAPSPQVRLIEEFVKHLTGGSLQSAESLFEVAAALGADADGLSIQALKPAFDVRNKIIHELDINLATQQRTRNIRSQTSMITYTRNLFDLAVALIKSVDGRISPAN